MYFVQRPNSIQSSISVGNLAVKRSDPRWFELTLANTIYGGAFNSRIVRNIREEKGYTYSPASILTGFADAGFYRFAADVRNEVTGPTLTEVYKEIDEMRAGGSDGAELQGAKSYLRGIFPIQTVHAERPGRDAEQRLRVQPAEGLSGDIPREDRRGHAGAGEDRGRRRCSAPTIRSSTIVGDWAKVKDQLGAFKNITFVDVDGKPSPPPQ